MALLKTTADLKKYISIDANTAFGTLKPFIEEAEKLYIIDVLGKEFYDEFSAAYAADPSVALSADNTALLPYIQNALSYYTQLKAIPHLSLTMGNMGMRQHRSDESDVAPRYKEERLQLNALKQGDIHADKLLEFLEQNAAADKYGTWFGSAYNTKNSGYIVYGTAVANKHIDIGNSRRIFLALRNAIREIETRIIPKLIGQQQYDELVVQLKTGGSGNPTNTNKALIALLEPIICKRALYMRLPFLRVQISQDGLFMYSGADDLYKLGQFADEKSIKEMRQQLKDGELGYCDDEQRLQQFIIDNIADYPLIAATPQYTTQPDPGPTWKGYDNSPLNKHFGAL